MATTALVSEIVIVGLEAVAWLVLLVLAIFGTGWIDSGALQGWAFLVTIAVLALAYLLGILVDRAGDLVQIGLSGRWPGKIVGKPADVATMRITIMREGAGPATFLDYQRSRLRIVRSTALNVVVSIPIVLAFLAVRTDLGWEPVAAAVVLLTAAAVLTELAYRSIEFAYVARLSDAYRVIRNLPTPDLGAAVPYRWHENRLQILLVHATASDKWTFPKGHPKGNETLAEAARREAREEAGVTGKLRGEELIEYAYPTGPDAARSNDYLVAAFLLEAATPDRDRAKAEDGREPEWFTLDQARAKAAEGGREPKYVEAMLRVLDAAARHLDRPPE